MQKERLCVIIQSDVGNIDNALYVFAEQAIKMFSLILKSELAV